ncbi:MAG: hypothetical protein UY76_C0016G0011 [Candidatus Uhrbacteria bacterium GW2011_GWA2_52_8d]|uniref:Uncharacterized protein n=1 Tax=Candidatus Uhrbacteria bacterium GW2011_GWA2_52_8d TaxID=1618979 RepID=A0A0G2AJQ1_9BACT|nr:MAG: hypothetical protein UY76_C0016G0011 [Candidatus Uhrbacteria bacterium GW2011_GWA2_52_8d]
MEMGDKIIEKLIEMDQKIDDIRSDMATKIDINELRTVLDNQGVILQRLDQERIFTLERIKRIEADVDKMKVVLHIA